jgi:tRNA (mo5U34)-methyltransferase
VRSLGGRFGRGGPRRHPPLADRYDEGRVSTPLLEQLDDADVRLVNELLPWQCFTVDSHGRAFGRAAWEGKRNSPQPVPDPRILLFDERFGVAGKRVLEVGCFEGVHTTALCRLGADVVAVDARVENIVKTIVRCAFFGESPSVVPYNLDEAGPDDEHLLRADLCHHIGVLYHLVDPVAHLQTLGRTIGRGIMLDSHYAAPEDATDGYEVAGRAYRCMRYREGGRESAFSGMESFARWLLLDDIVGVLRASGFDRVDVVERRQERNGPRVLLFAERSG